MNRRLSRRRRARRSREVQRFRRRRWSRSLRPGDRAVGLGPNESGIFSTSPRTCHLSVPDVDCAKCGLTERRTNTDCFDCRTPLQATARPNAKRREWTPDTRRCGRNRRKVFEPDETGTRAPRLVEALRHHGHHRALVVNLFMNGSTGFMAMWTVRRPWPGRRGADPEPLAGRGLARASSWRQEEGPKPGHQPGPPPAIPRREGGS